MAQHDVDLVKALVGDSIDVGELLDASVMEANPQFKGVRINIQDIVRSRSGEPAFGRTVGGRRGDAPFVEVEDTGDLQTTSDTVLHELIHMINGGERHTEENFTKTAQAQFNSPGIPGQESESEFMARAAVGHVNTPSTANRTFTDQQLDATLGGEGQLQKTHLRILIKLLRMEMDKENVGP